MNIPLRSAVTVGHRVAQVDRVPIPIMIELDTRMLDVLIAGAGPTGLTLAIELVRRGVAVRLIDSANEPFRGSRGKGLQPRTLEIFDLMGVIKPIVEAGALYPYMRLHFGPFSFKIGSLGTHHVPDEKRPYPNLWMVPQWRTEEILRSHLATLGGAVEAGVGLESLTQDERSVMATLSTGETVRAAYLVGCDGGRSTTRKAVGLTLHGNDLDHKTMIVADLEIEGLDRRTWHVWPMNWGGARSLCPLPNTNLFQLQAPATIDIDGLEAGILRTTGQRVTKIAWQSRFKHQTRMVDRYRIGRVLLAGDAAHIHPPSGAQGLNTGIQDAWNLGWKLAWMVRGGDQSVLDSYEQERLPVAAAVLNLAKKLHVAKSLKRGDLTNQLTLNYRDSPLSTGAPLSGLSPGDRMVNRLLPDGSRVFDALRHGGASQFASRSGQFILVRPDGYVASITQTKLETYAGGPVSHFGWD
jgi:2-polyprenyl-6-methoxyphenol hydroxylase-like FAD-dependent oxidoreductase